MKYILEKKEQIQFFMLRVPVPLGLLVFLLLASCCEQLRDKL